MKIILVHDYYASTSPSGENRVVDAERAMLEAQGHSVRLFSRHSDDLRARGARGIVQGALATPWNPFAAQALRDAVDSFGADVVHVHNTFPQISPSIFSALRGRAARVLTLHNYRIFCAAAVPLRDGQVCVACLDRRSPMPSLIHGCYRGSRIATAPLAAGIALHRLLGTWRNEVDAFIVLSDFQKALMADAGLPIAKMHVKPNFHSSDATPLPFAPLPFVVRRDSIVFVGRLSAEKGVRSLLRAWQAWGPDAPELRIVGDGALRAELEDMAAGLPVTFLGQIDSAAVQREIGSAKLLILPSEWFETFGLVILEAFAAGTPVAVSAIGPLPSLVAENTTGILFPPGNPTALLDRVRTLWNDPDRLQAMGQAAHHGLAGRFTEDANYAMLREIYAQAIAVAGRA